MAELTNQDGLPLTENEPATDPKQQRAVMIWRTVIILGAALFIGLLALRLVQTNTSEHRADGTAPDFEFITFDGETITLAELRGKGVVLNFWASWCDPCREEADLLEQTWRREEANGIIFLGLAYLDQEPASKDYLAEFDITYPNGPDLRSQVARRYVIKGVPETFFIDPEGKIAETVIGPIVNQRQLDGLLDKIRPVSNQ
jgi:cytochrome c biogenesis protein CcmG, thiol:disulfide interchange protein DsbE